MKVFKGNWSQLITEVGARVFSTSHNMQACRLLVIFLEMQSPSHRLLSRLLKGKLRKRSSHLLLTNISFFFLWSKERTRSSKVSCDEKVWKVCSGWRWVEHRGAWVKSSCNIALLKFKTKETSCRELFPVKSCLPRIQWLPLSSCQGWWFLPSISPTASGYQSSFLGRTAVDCMWWEHCIFLLH